VPGAQDKTASADMPDQPLRASRLDRGLNSDSDRNGIGISALLR